MSDRYSKSELEQVAFEKEINTIPEEEYQEDTRILKDLGIRRLAHRNAIIDQSYRKSMNVIQLRDSDEGWKWFQDQPVGWILGRVDVKPSTIWTFYHVANVRGEELYEVLKLFNVFIQLGDGNFISNFINRRGVKRFQQIFAPIMLVLDESGLKNAWMEIERNAS